jgi:hypothetical protein
MMFLGITRAVWLLAGLALLLGLARERVVSWLSAAQPLAPLETVPDAPWLAGGFRAGGAYPTTAAGLLPAGLPTAGSWLDGDEWQGRAETAWFRVTTSRIQVAVAGYPQNAGCRLRAELRHGDGSVTHVPCGLANPREQWGRWEFAAHGATAVRVVAEDGSSALGGWLAFSHPFAGLQGAVTAA